MLLYYVDMLLRYVGHVIKLCGYVITLGGHVIILCGHVITLCGHVIILCGYVNTLGGHVILLCGYLLSWCQNFFMLCGYFFSLRYVQTSYYYTKLLNDQDYKSCFWRWTHAAKRQIFILLCIERFGISDFYIRYLYNIKSTAWKLADLL